MPLTGIPPDDNLHMLKRTPISGSFSEVPSNNGHMWYKKLYGVLHKHSRCPPHISRTLPEAPIKILICSRYSCHRVWQARERAHRLQALSMKKYIT